MGVREVFERDAGRYVGTRRQLIPGFDDFYASAMSELDLPLDAPLRVLDLGAGTGLLAVLVADAFPLARVDLVDVSGAMLAEARNALGSERFTYRELDYLGPDLGGPYDAIVSALSIHHASDRQKRELFARVRSALRPGGVFVNADQVVGDQAAWLAEVRSSGVGEADLEAALDRMRHDRPSSVDDQLDWLREAGLVDVRCPYRRLIFAVLAGRRAMSDA